MDYTDIQDAPLRLAHILVLRDITHLFLNNYFQFCGAQCAACARFARVLDVLVGYIGGLLMGISRWKS